MKTLVIILSLLTTNLCFATDLIVVNKTTEFARIERLHNNCDNGQVPEGKPIFIEPGQSTIFRNLKPVVQTYMICGSGFCSSSAMGMKKDQTNYTLEIIIKNNMLDSKAIPDDWSTTDIECPK